jgi:hypothetical protein
VNAADTRQAKVISTVVLIVAIDPNIAGNAFSVEIAIVADRAQVTIVAVLSDERTFHATFLGVARKCRAFVIA